VEKKEKLIIKDGYAQKYWQTVRESVLKNKKEKATEDLQKRNV